MPGNVETQPPVRLPVILSPKDGLSTPARVMVALPMGAVQMQNLASSAESSSQIPDLLNPLKHLSPEKRIEAIKKVLPFKKIEAEIQKIDIDKMESDLRESKRRLDKAINVRTTKLNPQQDHDTQLKIKALEVQSKQTQTIIANLKSTLETTKKNIEEISKIKCQKEQEALHSPLNHVPDSVVNDLTTQLHNRVREPLAKAQKELAKLPKYIDDQLDVLDTLASDLVKIDIANLRKDVDQPKPE